MELATEGDSDGGDRFTFGGHPCPTSSATPAHGLGELRYDLERIVFLCGGSDGEPHFRSRASLRQGLTGAL